MDTKEILIQLAMFLVGFCALIGLVLAAIRFVCYGWRWREPEKSGLQQSHENILAAASDYLGWYTEKNNETFEERKAKVAEKKARILKRAQERAEEDVRLSFHRIEWAKQHDEARAKGMPAWAWTKIA